jgi:hypothetical protein
MVHMELDLREWRLIGGAGPSCRSWLMFLLDTNVVSELRRAKAGKADLNVVARAATVEPSALFLSAITVLELEVGVRLA